MGTEIVVRPVEPVVVHDEEEDRRFASGVLALAEIASAAHERGKQ